MLNNLEMEMGNRKRSLGLILLALTTSAAWSTNKPPTVPSSHSEAQAISAAQSTAVGVGIAHGGDADARANAVGLGGAGGDGGHADARAAGGAGGDAQASQTQTATGGAGGTASNLGNAQNVSLNYRDRLQAPSISAPAIYASNSCATGWSAGLSIPGGGISGGRSKSDPLCDRREVARVLMNLNPALALRVLCSDPYVAAVADVDAGDCLYIENIQIERTESRAPTAPPFDESKYATKEELERAFKKSQSK